MCDDASDDRDTRFTLFLIGPGQLADAPIICDVPEIRVEPVTDVQTRREPAVGNSNYEPVRYRQFRVMAAMPPPVNIQRARVMVDVPGSPGVSLVVPVLIHHAPLAQSSPARGLATNVPRGTTVSFEFTLSPISDARMIDWDKLQLSVDPPDCEAELDVAGGTSDQAILRVTVPAGQKLIRGEVRGTCEMKHAFMIPFVVTCRD